MPFFINSRPISGNRARSSAVSLAEGATSRAFVGSKLRCALLTLGVSSLMRATIALTAAVSVQPTTRRLSEVDAVAVLPTWLSRQLVACFFPPNPQLLTGLRGAPEALFKV